MTNTFVLGSTGLVGNEVLRTLLALPAFPTLSTISRRAPPQSDPKLTSHVAADSATWPALYKEITPTPTTVISGLGCTRAQAGSLEKQWAIDHGINVAVAKAAKEAGAKTFVLVSSGGCASFPGNLSPYGKLKNAIEKDIGELGFEHYVIVRPGAIIGEREVPHSGQGLITGMYFGIKKVFPGVADGLGQEAGVIGKACVAAVKEIEAGKAPKGKWILEQSDIVRLGRTEWKE